LISKKINFDQKIIPIIDNDRVFLLLFLPFSWHQKMPTFFMATEDANLKDSPVMPCDRVTVKLFYIYILFRYINVKNYYFNIFKEKKHNTFFKKLI